MILNFKNNDFVNQNKNLQNKIEINSELDNNPLSFYSVTPVLADAFSIDDIFSIDFFNFKAKISSVNI